MGQIQDLWKWGFNLLILSKKTLKNHHENEKIWIQTSRLNLEIKSALKSTGKSLKSLEKALEFYYLL